MKKLIVAVLTLMLALSCLTCLAESAKPCKVGLVLMIENGAFMDMKQGILEGLAELGYRENENLTVDYRNAQGDATNLNTICQGMDDGTYDLVITIATPATQAFVAL